MMEGYDTKMVKIDADILSDMYHMTAALLSIQFSFLRGHHCIFSSEIF